MYTRVCESPDRTKLCEDECSQRFQQASIRGKWWQGTAPEEEEEVEEEEEEEEEG